jgi:L-fuculose-phosphate aldolase
MIDSDAIRQEIIQVCRRLYTAGMVAASDGNVSARVPEGLLITAAGSRFAELEAAQIVALDAEGNPTGATTEQPSSELGLHLEIYRLRPEVNAVIHAHAPYCTAFSLTGREALDTVVTEVSYFPGAIPIAPAAKPGTPEVAAAVRPLIPHHDAVILARHGVVTVGKSLKEAFWTLERVEHDARICYLAATLNRGPRP